MLVWTFLSPKFGDFHETAEVALKENDNSKGSFLLVKHKKNRCPIYFFERNKQDMHFGYFGTVAAESWLTI